MICIISPSYRQADKWAQTQNLASSEWFYLSDVSDVGSKINFHTIVIGEFEQHKLQWFERVYRLAKTRGAIGRS